MIYAVREKLNTWMQKYNRPDTLLEAPQQMPLSQLAEKAKEDWHQAQAYFENVNDPELVDYAINNLEAAEKRYNYLLKKLREQ